MEALFCVGWATWGIWAIAQIVTAGKNTGYWWGVATFTAHLFLTGLLLGQNLNGFVWLTAGMNLVWMAVKLCGRHPEAIVLLVAAAVSVAINLGIYAMIAWTGAQIGVQPIVFF